MSVLNIKYRQLKAFTLAVETGSFKRAADQIAVTQPSFSMLIRELENDTGVLLFERSARRCVATAAGEAFYALTAGALANLEDAYRHIKSVGAGTEGKLAFAALPSLASGIVADKLSAFRKKFPRVRISLSEGRHDEILTDVRHAQVEFGLGSMLREDEELTFRPLFKDRLMIVAPRGHEVLSMPPVWRSLDRFDLVLLAGGPAEHGLKVSHVEPSRVLEVAQLATALAMVRFGMGISVLPSTMLPGLHAEGLAYVPMRGRLAIRQLGLIHKKTAHLSAAAKAFIASLTQPEP